MILVTGASGFLGRELVGQLTARGERVRATDRIAQTGVDSPLVEFVSGDLLDAETMYAAKKLLQAQGSSLLEGRQTGLTYDVSSFAAVNFNSTIAGVEDADVVLLIGSNPRWEAPLVNTRLRKIARKGRRIFAIGPEADLGMKVSWLGNDLKLLARASPALVM